MWLLKSHCSWTLLEVTLIGMNEVVLKSLLSVRDQIFSSQYFFYSLESDTVTVLCHLLYLSITKLIVYNFFLLRTFHLCLSWSFHEDFIHVNICICLPCWFHHTGFASKYWHVPMFSFWTYFFTFLLKKCLLKYNVWFCISFRCTS